MTIEAMKQALEALETCMYPQQKQMQAITALRQAIEQAEKQEPVIGTKTWYEDGKVITQNLYPSDVYKQEKQEPVAYPDGDVVGPCICGSWPGGKCLKCPRITPPAQREWVRLTDEEIQALASWWPSYDQMPALKVLIKDVTNSLKEKNT